MQIHDLHTFFLYVIFGHIFAYGAVVLCLRLFPLQRPAQRMALYLLALLSPLLAFILYHSVFTKQCHTAFPAMGWTVAGFLCQVGMFAYDHLTPLLLFFIGAAMIKGLALPLFVARTRRQAVKLQTSEEERFKRILTGQCAILGLPVPGVIFSKQKHFAAFIAGIGKPVLVISAWMLARLTDNELKAVLTHELVHIRRRDTFFSYLLQLLRGATFFSPFSASLLRLCFLENERRCDREAASILGDVHSYSAALLRVWKLLLDERGKVPAFARSFSGNRTREMELRLTSLLQATPGGKGRTLLQSFLFYSLAAAVAACTILFLGLIC